MSLNIHAQILRPTKDVEKYITGSTHQLNKKLFKGPSFQQPIVYIDYSPMHPMIAGLTREVGPGIFMVDLNPMYGFNTLEWTLLHELVHVWQISNDILSKDDFGFIWHGSHYPYGTVYALRPWEIHAEEVVKSICN